MGTKIKLKVNLPVAPKHGAVEGEVFDLVREDLTSSGKRIYFFESKNGENCGVFPHECELVEDEKSKSE